MRRIMVFLMTVLMAFGLSAPAFAADTASYTDVPSTHWAYSSIESCASKGLMQGVGDNKFDPESNLTRAQVAQICYNAYKDKLPSMITNKMISDVAADAWYRDAMYWILANGIVNGSIDENGDTFVYPNATADRKYVALVLNRLAGKLNVELPKTHEAIVFPDIGELGAEYQKSIGALQQAGVISGFPDGTYQPNGSLTRAQAAKLFDVYTNIDGLNLTAAEDPPVVTPPVKGLMTPEEFYATLESYAESYGFTMDTPSTQTVPSGQVSDIDLSNGSYLIRVNYAYNTEMTNEIFAYYVFDSNLTQVEGGDAFLHSIEKIKPILEKYSK